MFTIKNRLIGLTIFCLFLGCLIGISNYGSILSLTDYIHLMKVQSEILRNQMYADMMHDAIGIDVQIALSPDDNIESVLAAESDLKAHSEALLKSFENNKRLVTSPKTLTEVESTLITLQSYIDTAKKLC